MSVLIFFGMCFFVIALGIGVIVSSLLQWKREGLPKRGAEPRPLEERPFDN
jgi:hypothetical protein